MWDYTHQTNLEKTDVQKRLIRLITGSPYCAHIEPLFVANKILTIKENHESTIGVFMYKSQNGDLPEMVIKHTEIYMVEKLEMLRLYMYHVGDLTPEGLA